MYGALSYHHLARLLTSQREIVEPIRVKSYPIARTFDSLESAVAHARTHPLLPEARRDAARLRGALFVDACWTLFEWIIRFDCDLSLRVSIEQAEVRWSLQPSQALSDGEEFQRVGVASTLLDWAGTISLREMDCAALVAKRRGARFKDLFVNEFGLFVYLHSHLIPSSARASGKRE